MITSKSSLTIRLDNLKALVSIAKALTCRVAVATQFQRAFMQLLYDAQFEELSARDLMLTSALNTDYLLTLPIYVDWKKASESNAIIFKDKRTFFQRSNLQKILSRTGSQNEADQGFPSNGRPKHERGIFEAIYYSTDMVLSGFISGVTYNYLAKFVVLHRSLLVKEIELAFKSAYQTQEIQVWIKRMKLWLEELSLFQQSYSYKEQTSDYLLDVDKLSDSDLPIWLAAQKAVTRYEGLLSPVGPRGRLLRKLLTWSGLIPSTTETTFELQNDNTASELYLGFPCDADYVYM
ncbi:hypothetical protein CK203_076551 [Vitis vinifera]|uniref:Uncharacterized protein n=1 Tax=Vitis vinifera TaxID=29760 RepID=A0A438DB03_VITVI|nr:hypothetical protein CK203_076551 [Vitis vinifera]